MAVLFASEAGTLVTLGLLRPETLNHRGAWHAGVKRFDLVFAAVWLLAGLLTPIVAGLDAARFHWTALPWWCFHIGTVILFAATGIAAWAMVENEHFEQFARIQDDRDHHVVTSGPYRFIRHPGYAAAVVGAVSTPLLFGSGWTFPLAGLVAALFVVRTKLEDDVLRAELPGYSTYAKKTLRRLVPFIW